MLPCPWGFSRQEYWTGLPCPPPGDLPNPGVKLRSPALQVDSLPSEPPRKPKNTGVGSLSLLPGIFPTQESNWGLLHCKQILYQLSCQGSPQLTLQHHQPQTFFASVFSVPKFSPWSHVACRHRVFLNSFHLQEFPSFSLFLMILMFSKNTGQVFCRMGFARCFLVIRWGYGFQGYLLQR